MDMIGIGWGEMMVIGLVALVVVGPEKLPEMARTIGKFYGQLRRMADETSRAISTEVDMIKAETLPEADKDALKRLAHPTLEEIKKNFTPEYLMEKSDSPDALEDSPSVPATDGLNAAIVEDSHQSIASVSKGQ